MDLRLPEEKTSAAASSIQKYIRDQLTKQRASFTDLTITRITKKIFYGFTAQTFYPFLQIDVPSISLFRTLRSMFLDEFLNSVMYLDDNTNIIAKRPDAPPPRGKKISIQCFDSSTFKIFNRVDGCVSKTESNLLQVIRVTPLFWSATTNKSYLLRVRECPLPS
jgi:hypothetical protein